MWRIKVLDALHITSWEHQRIHSVSVNKLTWNRNATRIVCFNKDFIAWQRLHFTMAYDVSVGRIWIPRTRIKFIALSLRINNWKKRWQLIFFWLSIKYSTIFPIVLSLAHSANTGAKVVKCDGSAYDLNVVLCDAHDANDNAMLCDPFQLQIWEFSIESFFFHILLNFAQNIDWV